MKDGEGGQGGSSTWFRPWWLEEEMVRLGMIPATDT